MKKLFALALLLVASGAQAEGWCDLQPGWGVVTHGTKSDSVWLLGKLPGQANEIWIEIANATSGKSNVALALAAQMAGKSVSIYIDSPTYSCANFPSGAANGGVRYLKVIP